MNLTKFQKTLIKEINKRQIKSLYDFLSLYVEGDGRIANLGGGDESERANKIYYIRFFKAKGQPDDRVLNVSSENFDTQLSEFVQVIKLLLSLNMVIMINSAHQQIFAQEDLGELHPFLSSVIEEYNKQYFIAIPTLQSFIEHDFLTDLERNEKRVETAEKRAEIAEKRTFVVAFVSIIVSIISAIINVCITTDIKIENLPTQRTPMPVSIISSDTVKKQLNPSNVTKSIISNERTQSSSSPEQKDSLKKGKK